MIKKLCLCTVCIYVQSIDFFLFKFIIFELKTLNLHGDLFHPLNITSIIVWMSYICVLNIFTFSAINP